MMEATIRLTRMVIRLQVGLIINHSFVQCCLQTCTVIRVVRSKAWSQATLRTRTVSDMYVQATKEGEWLDDVIV